MQLLCLRVSIGVVFCLFASLGPLKAENQVDPRIMLVLDGSSSMWARVDGDVSKIEIAKGAIAELVGDWEAKMEFGITTYGHREESSCQDIETVLPLDEVNSDKVVNVVDGITPKGKTPLAAALRQAAKSLDYENQPAKILLVSDGIENCGQDPCQAASELAANAKDLSIDIIGFDMNNHEMGQLECIATNGNGHMVRAEVGDFSKTMDHTMTAAIEEDTSNATLSISTLLLGQTLTQSLRYVIYANDDDGKLTKVAESFSAAPSLKLPAGKFIVEVIHGDEGSEHRSIAEIELAEADEVEHVFNFDELRPLTR
ncbi:MAG: vWA domain-containing protein [Geminicoccaceae bacterium]